MDSFNTTGVLYTGLAAAGVATVVSKFNSWRRLASIPTVGGSDLPIISLLGAKKFLTNGTALMDEGYARYKGHAFKVAMPDRWLVLLAGDDMVDELRKLPDDVMSFTGATNQMIETKYTLGPEIAESQWHTHLVKTQLTKNLDVLFPDVREEVVVGFDEFIGNCDDWVAIPALSLLQNVVCRASNRVFLGFPKCRDQDWVDLNVSYTREVQKSRLIINRFPPFLKPLAGNYLTTVPANTKRALSHMEPIVTERRRRMAEEGQDYPDKPNDMLTWLLDDPRGQSATLRDITARILGLNFAAVETSASTALNALYTLAAYPKWVAPLREEIETITQKHGWTKAAMAEMVKLDSFLKECTRFYGFSAFSLMRLALRDHTFQDGTTIPAGSLVAVPSTPIHGDTEYYERADEFMPFRFTEGYDDVNSKRQFTATSLEYLAFGHGKHACPGRFFASNEIKVILSHLVMTYDIKTEVEGVRPPSRDIGPLCMPNPTAKLLFRKRQDV